MSSSSDYWGSSRRPHLHDADGRVMSDGCVICGRANPHGLKMRFQTTPEGVRSTVTVPERFQGFDGVAHGGTVAAILDDAMWWAILRGRAATTMTAEMTVRYHAPVPIERPLVVEASLVSHRGRLHRARAMISFEGSDGNGALAEAEGAYLAPAQCR
ncbi:MAG: PaaI family thioesterase [Clostridia bacterium]